MTTKLAKHTPGALRAAGLLLHAVAITHENKDYEFLRASWAEIIDAKTHAPAMLEALETLTNLARICLTTGVIDARMDRKLQEAVNQSGAAIRAAVGAQEENTQ